LILFLRFFVKGVTILIKHELVVAIAEKTGMTQVNAEKALKGIIEATVAEVARKGKVQLVGFGAFVAHERAARTGVDPSGKAIKIPAATVPVFKPGKPFREAVNVKPAKKKAAKKKK